MQLDDAKIRVLGQPNSGLDSLIRGIEESLQSTPMGRYLSYRIPGLSVLLGRIGLSTQIFQSCRN